MYRKTQSSHANALCADDMLFFSPMRRYALFLLAAFLAPALPAGVAQDGPFGTRYDYAFGADGCFRTAHGTSAREPVAPVPERWRGYFSGGFGVVPSGLQHLVVTNGGIRAGALVYHTVTDRWFETNPARLGVRPPYSWINYAVIGLYLLGMAAMGFWFMRRNRSSDDYFRAGGRLPWWVVSLSIYATMFSSITFLSIPAMSFLGDCRYFVLAFGIFLLAPVVVKWYLPFFRRLNLTSAYEFLEVRFNLAARLFASAAFVAFMVARTAIVTYLPAVAIAAVTGLDVNLSIVAISLVTILYCTVGGVEAVVWSDFVQSIILIGSTIAILVFLVVGTDGGLSGFVQMGAAAGKFRVFDFVLDWTKPCFWVAFVGGIVANLASYTSDQCVVQRYMTTRDEAGAAKSILFNGVLSVVNCAVFFVIGVALWTFFASHPEQLGAVLEKNDAVFPVFIANSLPTGFSGLVLAAVAAATMSTLSANLNSAASAVTADFYARLVPGATERGKFRCGVISTVVTGLLGGAFALVLANAQILSIYDEFQRFLGILTAGLGSLFFMGVFMKRVNGAGALAGLLANYAVTIGLDRVAFPGKPHLLLYGTLGMVVSLIVAPIVSAAVGAKGKGKGENVGS